MQSCPRAPTGHPDGRFLYQGAPVGESAFSISHSNLQGTNIPKTVDGYHRNYAGGQARFWSSTEQNL